MDKYLYAFSKEDRDELLTKGFNFVGEQNIAGKNAYLFEGNLTKAQFSELDKKKFLFTNIAFFRG